MAEAPLSKNRRDIARILKQNEFNILDSSDEIIGTLNQAFIQEKSSTRLDLVSARSHAPKILNLYYVYGSISRFSRA